MSDNLSYSDIKHLLKHNINPHKETEPILAESIPIREPVIEAKEKKTKKVILTIPETEKLEVIPDLPEIDQDLLDDGIEITDPNTIFVRNRKIELPMSLEKVNEGLHKPLTSGLRWLSEITKLILAKFHLIIKKAGKKLKIIEQP